MRLLKILIIICPVIVLAQTKKHFDNHVECFYDKEFSKELVIYNDINGKKILSLKNGEKYCWYKLAVKKTKKGWAKIHNLYGMLDCSESKKLIENNNFKNSWVKLDNFKIFSFFAPRGKNYVSFYEKPNLNSKEIVRINDFTKYQLIETKKLWAKVKFKFKGKNYCGWIHIKNQCSNIWTAC